MKFRSIFKRAPSDLYDDIEIAANYDPDTEDGPEVQTVIYDSISAARLLCQQWTQYDEMVTIEFDTVAGTAVVIPNVENET